MAKRVYLSESDGTPFDSKSEAEAYDASVEARKLHDTFFEKFALFLSETDFPTAQSEPVAEASSALLSVIRDNPLAFMEVMEVILPKQWQRKLHARRGETTRTLKRIRAKTISPKKNGRGKSKKQTPEDSIPPETGPLKSEIAQEEIPPAPPEETIPPAPPEETIPPAPPEAGIPLEEFPPPPPEDMGELTPLPDMEDELTPLPHMEEVPADESPIPSIT